MNKIIAFAGKLQSGKTTSARIVQRLYPDYEIVSFGTKVKEVLSLVTGKSIEEINAHKEDMYVYGMTYREALQTIGTDLFRNSVHKDIWVDALFANYTPESRWIIDDVRFPNEVKAIQEHEGIVIRLLRETKSSWHISEKALDFFSNFDWCIDNNGTTEDLKEQIEQVLKTL